ncbi:hypothetical protein [Streptomyces sp. V1I1]|uniref:hypothetical protein n=1 Tax=Streptomyces sp. V1I1 TaxID=3042272 RepID=UPI0027839C88|nr:hypothetical protein [Streptomyces sp. V1I1]MDQ0943321.1 hypothetical protein [Streptomyces sp. V1I1]
MKTNITAPTSTEPELYESEDGKRWKLAGTDSAGGRLFVPEYKDPADVPRWVWAKEAELAAAVGALSPVGGAA